MANDPRRRGSILFQSSDASRLLILGASLCVFREAASYYSAGRSNGAMSGAVIQAC
jgi:hypothetical protein